MKWTAIIVLAALASAANASSPGQDTQVDLGTLLDEMIDRGAIARFPVPAYTCRQFSSYDRASVTPADAADAKGWFANGDRGHYLRTEKNGGRDEWVMMDAAGPGAVVRIWSANPQGTLRVYLDGATTPALEAPMTDLLGGTWGVVPPLSAQRARGWNLYLPIPYAQHCKITSDKGEFYYQVNYRTYEPGTRVESFTMERFGEAWDRLDRVQEKLAFADSSYPRGWNSVTIGAGEEIEEHYDQAYSGALREFSIQIQHDDLETALRTTVMRFAFDGEEAVWCPVGDFFNTGAGMNPQSDWYRTVREDGTMCCRWVMPFRESSSFALINLNDSPVVVRYGAHVTNWDWDERSMHFHARWHQQNPIPTRPMRDWNYVQVEGKGVFVGDNLAVANPVRAWWGEGDEKIWVDGEDFPSHFGTGTEDYYGYAWCCNEPFYAPFHSQPRCDGPNNYGHTLVSRVRALDTIPFTKSFQLDMEVWHWTPDIDVGYAATSYFYALPGAIANRGPAAEEAARGLLDPPPLPPPFEVEGALECEKLEVLAQTAGIPVGPQGGHGPDLWSMGEQLWVQAQQPGDFVELKVPVEKDGKYKVELWATRSRDYGIVVFSIDGKSTGLGVDLFNLRGKQVVNTGPLDLGTHEVKDGAFVLRCEVVGGNPASLGSRSFFGLDCVLLTPVTESGG